MHSRSVVRRLPLASRKTGAVSNPKRAREIRVTQALKATPKPRSFQKPEDVLEGLLAMLSVVYFIGAASFAGILIVHAFSN